MATKTPVSALRELCVKLNIEETYNQVSSYGPPNDPTFEMSVETNTGLKAVGKAKKKKEAQHMAAQALLDLMKGKGISVGAGNSAKLTDISLPPIIAGLSSCPTHPSNGPGVVTLNTTSENAVGRLQEYCQSKNWNIPTYTFVSMQGDSHRPTFTMKCEVGKFNATGVARTKQQAKQEAANTLYNSIINTSSAITDPMLMPSALPPAPKLSDKEKETIIEKYSLCKPLTEIPQTNPALKFGVYHKSMEDLLLKVRFDLDKQTFTSPVGTLKSITEKLGLKISYHEGRDITWQDPKREKCFVYAIVSTQPTTVQVGEGQSTSVATLEAAHRVLKYWQTFLGIFPAM